MDPKEYVLITGGAEVPAAVEEALGAALEVRRCPGPSAVDCPAVHGNKCPLRSGAKAAVVYLAGTHEIVSPGRWECAAAAPSPAIAVLEGSSQAPRGRGRFALVGDAMGPVGVLQALASLFDYPDRPEEFEASAAASKA
ncbi:MAG: hypothetical protein ACRDJI_02010 [Actinomycetota bacterium]